MSMISNFVLKIGRTIAKNDAILILVHVDTNHHYQWDEFQIQHLIYKINVNIFVYVSPLKVESYTSSIHATRMFL